jgi:Tfp pilus assembly protein PilX
MWTSSSARERGLALPMVIAVTAILAALLTAGYLLVGGQRRINDNQVAQLDVFAIARTGLQQYEVNRAGLGFTSKPPAASESTRVTITNGYADVVSVQLRPATSQQAALYLIRSHGFDTHASQSGTPIAERTVTQLAYWNVGKMTVAAGWTSLTGLQKNGASGTLSGTDGCGAQAAVAGVAVPTSPGYSQNGGASVPSGNPPILNMGTQAQADSAVTVDWNGIVNGGALTPDVTIPPGSWPSFSNPSYWPTIMVVGDATIPSGQGLLVITGSATISGSTTWNGIVLVGNTLTSNGNNTISGAVITGLNVLLGQNPGVNSVGNGNKTFQYNSCNVAAAVAAMGALVPFNNVQMDNWPTY